MAKICGDDLGRLIVGWKAEMNDRGVVVSFRNTETGEVVTARKAEKLFEEGQIKFRPFSDESSKSTNIVREPLSRVYTGQKGKHFIDATSVVILMPTGFLILLFSIAIFIRVKKSLAKK